MRILFYKNILLLFSIVCSFIFVINCSGDRPIQGFEFADPDERGNIDTTFVSTLVLEESFRDTVTATGFSTLLSLGAFEGLETQILIQFARIPDSVTVNQATLILRSTSIVGPVESAPFIATVHQVTSDWDEASVTFDNFQSSFSASSLAETAIVAFASDTTLADSLAETVEFEFNPEGIDLLNVWADTTSTVDNFGILINFTSSSFIKEFFSRINLVNGPRLEMIVTKGSEVDTTTVSVTEDAFLVRSLIEPPSGPLYVDNVLSRQSVIEFDLSSIPRESAINRANLILNVQESNSILKDLGTFRIRVDALSEQFIMPPDSLKIGVTIAVNALLNTLDNSFSIPIAALVQGWVTEQIENHGIILRASVPGLDVSRIAIFSNSLNRSLSPRLQIDFTSAPSNP